MYYCDRQNISNGFKTMEGGLSLAGHPHWLSPPIPSPSPPNLSSSIHFHLPLPPLLTTFSPKNTFQPRGQSAIHGPRQKAAAFASH